MERAIHPISRMNYIALLFSMVLFAANLNAQDFRRRSTSIELGYTLPFGYSTDRYKVQNISQQWGLSFSWVKSWQFSNTSGMSVSVRPEYAQRTMHAYFDRRSETGVLIYEDNLTEQFHQLRISMPIRYDFYLMQNQLRLSPGISFSYVPFTRYHSAHETTEYFTEYSNGGLRPLNPPKESNFNYTSEDDNRFNMGVFIRAEYTIIKGNRNKSLNLFGEFHYDLIDTRAYQFMDVRFGVNYRYK